MCKIEEQSKFCDDEMREFLDGSKCRNMKGWGFSTRRIPKEKETSQQGRSYLIAREDFSNVFFAMKTTSQ
jgi:hypothetical protein